MLGLLPKILILFEPTKPHASALGCPLPSSPRMAFSLLLEERVGIKINTDDVSRWVMQVEITGVDTHNEGHRGTQHIRQH